MYVTSSSYFLNPYKPRLAFAEARLFLTEAEGLFGRPEYWHVVDGAKAISWQFLGDYQTVDLSIRHRPDMIEVSYALNGIRADDTMVGKIMYDWDKRLSSLKERVAKPWDEWTEDEVLESPMWTCLYAESGGTFESLETAMVMYSYGNPSDPWVKRYFEWKSLRSSV
jgi:hypothetical protein